MCSGRQQNGVGEITQLLFSMWIVKKLKRKIKREKPPVQQPNYMASNNNRRNQTQLLSWLLSAQCLLHFPIFRPLPSIPAPFHIHLQCNYCVSVVLTDDCSTLFCIYSSLPLEFSPHLRPFAAAFSCIDFKCQTRLRFGHENVEKKETNEKKLTSWNKEKP